MAGHKTLIAYVTKGGATEESALAIADVLRQKHKMEVDVVNLKKDPHPDIAQYENVVIGSGVRMQRVYGEFLRFLENDFTGKKVVLFLSSMEAADPKTHEEAIEKYIKRNLEKYPRVKPVAYEAFGGRMKILRKVVSDGRDINKVREWADKVGRKFSGKR